TAADYFVLVLVTCQSRVFQLESSAGGRAGGVTRDTCMGSNNPVWRDMATETRLRCSFISAKSSELLGFLFRLVFCWLFWACSLLLLVLGFLSFNLFSFLYILVAFYLLANGHRFLLQKRRRLIRLWNLVLGLNVFVMLCKCALQLVGCSVSLNANARPWMRQLLRIQCLNMHVFDDYVALDKNWDDTVNNPGIAMDIVCFILLVIQKRVFLTRYFTEVRLDTELQSSFMSKGARIITLTLRRIWYENKRLEENEISYIRRKVDTLRPRQRQGRELTEHFLMVRSGTKDMFFKTDAQGRRRLSLDETDGQKDEPPNPQQLHSNAAEILFEQSLLKVTEFAHKPSLALRKAMVSLHRRQSRASGLDDDQAKRQSSERHTASPIPSMSDDNLAASSAAPLGRTSPFPLAIPEVELEADANEEDEDDAQSDVFDGISASAAVSGNLGAAVASADNLAAAAALATTADELDHLSSKTELASEVSDEKMMALTESLLDKIMYGLERICQALDRATADYRNIEEQISRSKLQAKGLRLETAQQASGDGEAVSDGLLTDRLLQLTIDPMPREQIESADDAHESAPPRPLPLPNGWWDAISRLFQLLQYLLLSRVTQLCYTLMVAYHLFHMSIFSLVYPIIVFTWGMLSWPYPTKRFWYSAIVYTMMWILARYCLQFILLKDLVRQDSAGFVGWLAKEMNVRPEYSTPAAELILLAVLFLQRSTLKRFGLWDISRKNLQPASADPSPEKPTQQQQQQNLPTAADSSSSGSALPPLSSPTICVRRRKAKSELLSRSQQPPPSDADEAAPMLPPGELSDEQRPPSPPPPEPTLATPTSISSAAAVVNFFHRLATFHSAREFFKKAKKIFLFELNCTRGCSLRNLSRCLLSSSAIRKASPRRGPLRIPPSSPTSPRRSSSSFWWTGRYFSLNRAGGKFFFHIGHVILLHAYLKFILPAMSSHNYIAESSVIKLFYASKCIYFALSAYQILSGYPSRILGNFICKRHNYLNLFSFKGYMLVPFLFELRSVMDWMLTNTALGISHWLLMEEIYSTVFVAKCWRRAEIAYPTERAKNRPPVYKYCPACGSCCLSLPVSGPRCSGSPS
uniref:Piezo_RRas_bdg domain-containing protein n=1 Tax=Macrostomum lignano TaxID=282301 RepID=A0A1I8GQH9_9PLAT